MCLFIGSPANENTDDFRNYLLELFPGLYTRPEELNVHVGRRIGGAREHNLKNLTLEIPRDKLVVITGLNCRGAVAFQLARTR